MKTFFLQMFTWWNGTTLGTRFYTWRRGNFVGEDQFGNRYFRAQGHVIDPSVGSERRWVIYNGETDMSKVPAGWRGWLAHTVETPPTEEEYVPRSWEMPHVQNNTGTIHAYRPQGSILRKGTPEKIMDGEYQPWMPS